MQGRYILKDHIRNEDTRYNVRQRTATQMYEDSDLSITWTTKYRLESCQVVWTMKNQLPKKGQPVTVRKMNKILAYLAGIPK